MHCIICGRDTPPWVRYCDRCRDFFRANKDKLKRRTALQAAYDKTVDGFRDHWSCVVLEERDLDDPFHLCFDHRVPVEESELVVSSELFNQMKSQLSPEEFRRAFEELAAHLDGEPFDRDCIKFEYWRHRASAPPPPPRRLQPWELATVLVDECVVCGAPPIKWSYYCTRCRRLVAWQGGPRTANARALKEAWCEEEDGFLCKYTGVRVDEDDPGSPWYISFDHAVPGDRDTLVVSAYWVNMMKTALSADEFEAVVREYDRYLCEGGEFDRHVVEFRHWRRTRRASRRRRR